jgi:hypothetical protein
MNCRLRAATTPSRGGLWALLLLAGGASVCAGAVADLPLQRPCAADAFVPEVRALGVPQIRYIDPEPLAGDDRLVFQTGEGRLWIGELDPVSAQFRSGHGLDRLLDQGLVPVSASNNGPEWGISKQGTSVYYVKSDPADVLQLWRVRLGADGFRRRQLTSGLEDARGIRPSVTERENSVLLFFGVGTGDDFRQVWAPEFAADAPQTVRAYYPASGGGRFLVDRATGRTKLLYSIVVSTDPELRTQLALKDLDSGRVDIITDDGGQKFEPRQFNAVEYGDELLIASLIDRDRVAIYRDLNDGSGYWTRIEELTLPPGQSQRFLYSIKPVTVPGAPDGIGGTSYFTLVANAENNLRTSDGAMWVFGLGDGAERLCRRVDQGAVTGDALTRFEPEPFPGSEELFVIYNVLTGAEPQLSVANTGLTIGER